MRKKKITKSYDFVCFGIPHAVLITTLRQEKTHLTQLMKVISKETGFSATYSHLSNVINKLVESKLLLVKSKGSVKYVKSKGRVKYVSLTAKGKRVAFHLEQIRLKICKF